MKKGSRKIITGEEGNMALKSVESQNVEFKSNWRDEYLKVISAFANADGGKLMIGIDDKGNPIGIENAKKLLEDVPNKTWGRGTVKITNECKKAKLPEPEFTLMLQKRSVFRTSFPQAKRVGNPSEKEERFRTSWNDRITTPGSSINEPHHNTSYLRDTTLEGKLRGRRTNRRLKSN